MMNKMSRVLHRRLRANGMCERNVGQRIAASFLDDIDEAQQGVKSLT